MPRTTELLSAIATAARASRVRFNPPESYFSQVTETYAEVWFPTGGCIWDEIGHCTTCNYGAPTRVEPDAMVRAVEVALASLAPTTQTLWVSAFNTLQDREVPPDARRRIFELLATSPARTIITETHPASVRASVVAECVKALGDRKFGVELGVETMDEFVRYACVNKPFTNATLRRAVTIVHDAGAQAWANLIVGIPFLSRDEVIAGTADSIAAAVRMGFDHLVLFPNHVKEHTVAEILARGGRYSPPDLWTMRDVLAATPQELLDRVHLAWLDLKPHPGAPTVQFEPDPTVTVRLHRLLERFNLLRDTEALQEAMSLPSPVPPGEKSIDGDLFERLIADYQWLAQTHGEAGWWDKFGTEVTAELKPAHTITPN